VDLEHNETETETKAGTEVKKTSPNKMLFGDPKEYDNLTEQQQADYTAKMMQRFKHWAGQSSLAGKKDGK
jgi:hypothetical protein